MTSSFVLWMVYFSRLGASQFLRPISFRLISDRKEPIRIDRHMLDASTFSDLWKKKKKKKKDARSSNSIHKNNIIVYWKGLSWRWNTFFSRSGRKKKKKEIILFSITRSFAFSFFSFHQQLIRLYRSRRIRTGIPNDLLKFSLFRDAFACPISARAFYKWTRLNSARRAKIDRAEIPLPSFYHGPWER